MAGPSTSSTVLIVGISILSALVVFLVLLTTLLVIRWRKNTKGRNLDNRFIVSNGNDIPVNTLDMQRTRSTYRQIHTMPTHQFETRSGYQPMPPPIHFNQHPKRAADTLYAEPQVYTVSKRAPPHYATIFGNSPDIDEYPYAVVKKPAVHHDARVSHVNSMRSSAGIDLGAQYPKVSKRTSSHYATISRNSDDFPYAVVNKPAVHYVPRVSHADSMRSSAGVDLGAQYQKAQWILREESATSGIESSQMT